MPLQLNQKKTSLLKPLKNTFESFLEKNILRLGNQGKLRDACEYALLNGGKRVRPLIVMMVSNAVGKDWNVLEACLSVEYFHTASLIADDLPCMDNDDFRRNKPALHKIHGETTAILASYALISAGYEKILHAAMEMAKNSERSNEACTLALDAATRCAGISGAVGGQYQDLFPNNISIQEVEDVIYKKTVTLFEIAFIFGWIFGGGSFEKTEEIRKAAYHFGMAFQLWDDIGDVEQDDEGSVNIAHILGCEGAKKRLDQEVEAFAAQMERLGIWTPEFEQAISLFY